jgi:4-hydroxybutyrate CoA-transferase
MQYVSAEQAVGLIKNNERVFIHGGCATPERLVNALTNRSKELKGVEITHMHTEGEAPYARPKFSEAFHVNAFFIAKNIRPYVNEQHVQYIPMFLSEIPMFIRSGKFSNRHSIDTS